jgi:hypothetical protein
MADCIAAEITRESAVQRQTHEKQARVWKHWGEYNKFIKNEDLFLESFSWQMQIKLIGDFALALHEGWFSGPDHDKLVESTVSGTIQYVCATLRKKCFPNLSFNEDARSGLILQQLYQAFRKADPVEKHQKAIPMCVIAKIGKRLLQSSQLPFSNSLALQSSLYVNLENISKSQKKSRDKQQSFAFKTSDSSETASSSITMTQN